MWFDVKSMLVQTFDVNNLPFENGGILTQKVINKERDRV